MSRRDFDSYWLQMLADYKEMTEVLKELEQVAMEKPISPDKLDNVQQNVDKLKENLDRVSYIKYLLDKPVKKAKQPWYKKRNDALIKQLQADRATLDDVHNENKGYIENVKNI